MEDADPGIPDLCHTEHPGTDQPGEQAGKESGAGRLGLEGRLYRDLCSFFRGPQADPSFLLSATGFLLRLIGFEKPGELNWATGRVSSDPHEVLRHVGVPVTERVDI